jgi:RNA polymerase sigma-70 factor (sigma-E family)
MSEESEFDDYVRASWPRLVRAAFFAGCSIPEAEDVVQSALVSCVRNRRRLAAANDLDAYVHRIVFNTLASSRRRKWRGELPTAELPHTAVPNEEARVDLADAVQRSLKVLSTAHRHVVVLRFYAHFSDEQIAGALEVPLGTVKSRMSRALSQLSTDQVLADLRGAL